MREEGRGEREGCQNSAVSPSSLPSPPRPPSRRFCSSLTTSRHHFACARAIVTYPHSSHLPSLDCHWHEPGIDLPIPHSASDKKRMHCRTNLRATPADLRSPIFQRGSRMTHSASRTSRWLRASFSLPKDTPADPRPSRLQQTRRVQRNARQRAIVKLGLSECAIPVLSAEYKTGLCSRLPETM